MRDFIRFRSSEEQTMEQKIKEEEQIMEQTMEQKIKKIL
jgi:hypothetical protein